MKLEPGCKLRLSCPKCTTMCEAAIPAHAQNPSQKVRFFIRCPECREVHDLLKMSNIAISVPCPPPVTAVDLLPKPSEADTAEFVQPKRKASEPPAEGDAKPPAAKVARPLPICGGKAAEGTSRAVEHSAGAMRGSNGPGGLFRPTNERLGVIPKVRGAKAPRSQSPSGSSATDAREAVDWGESSDGSKRPTHGASTRGKAAVKRGDPGAFIAGAVRKASAGRGHGRGGRAGRGARRASAPSGEVRITGGARGAVSDNLDEFEIQEAAERIDASRTQTGLSRAMRPPRYSIVWRPRELPGRPSCDEAFDLAEAWAARRGSATRFSPGWRAGDEVEVAWKGKGFEGAWAEADVLSQDDARHVLVRFRQFVDENGSALVERMHVARLRLRPAARVAGWIPAVGDKVEGEWNDCWWEGTVRELHALKGVLFEYERYTNWTWLPPRAVRDRPPLWAYYPCRAHVPPAAGGAEEELPPIPEGACGTLGCLLPNHHIGLCSIAPKMRGSRRANLQERAVVQQQQRLWQEITSKRDVAARMAQARAEALLKTEKAGTSIIAPKGNRAQWHVNFRLDEFSAAMREVRVVALPRRAADTHVRGSGAGGSSSSGGDGGSSGGSGTLPEDGKQLRGVLVFGLGDRLADMAHMLRTELGFLRDAHVECYSPPDGKTVQLSTLPQCLEVTSLLPAGDCELHVRDPIHEACAVLVGTTGTGETLHEMV